MIKAILFDAGGVLLNLDVEACRVAFKEILGYDKIDELLDPCHQKGIYGDLEEGKIDSTEFRRLVLSESRPGSTPEMVDACMAALLTDVDACKAEYLRELSKKYDLYVLSNNNEISWARFEQIFLRDGIPLRKIFKNYFISCRIGILKPDIRIYRHVLDAIGLPPEEILFIDDSMSNVEAASSLGVRARFYEIGSDLKALIESEL